MGKKVISLNDIRNCIAEGKREIVIDKNTILTPSARDLVLTSAVKIIETEGAQSPFVEKCTFSKSQIMELIKSVVKEKNMNVCESSIEKIAELVLKQI